MRLLKIPVMWQKLDAEVQMKQKPWMENIDELIKQDRGL